MYTSFPHCVQKFTIILTYYRDVPRLFLRGESVTYLLEPAPASLCGSACVGEPVQRKAALTTGFLILQEATGPLQKKVGEAYELKRGEIH